MRATTLLSVLLGLKRTRVRGFEFTSAELILDVEPTSRRPYCGGCFQRAHTVHDRRERTWRHLDLGGLATLLRYAIRRVVCRRCGVTTELIPWAEPGSGGFTREFEDRVAYITQRTDRTTVSTLMRVAWETVGRIAARVAGRIGPSDPLKGLTHIGVDEISYRKHHKYLTVVVDHVLGRVVWVKEGRNAETLQSFFDDLGPQRTAQIQVVTLDMSASYIRAVQEAAPQAQLVFDRFHVQRLAHDALDALRREQWREQAGTEEGQAIKHMRWILLKNPWNLEHGDHERLAVLSRTNASLYRGYLLKEALIDVLDRRQVHVARERLTDWLAWAARSRLRPFVKLARTIRKYFDGILAYVATGLSNGRTEGLNGKIRTLTRRAYGFHSATSLIGLILLCCRGIELLPKFHLPGSASTNM